MFFSQKANGGPIGASHLLAPIGQLFSALRSYLRPLDATSGRAGIPAIIAVASITILFFNPSIALTTYWLMLVFHFLPGRHHPPALNE